MHTPLRPLLLSFGLGLLGPAVLSAQSTRALGAAELPPAWSPSPVALGLLAPDAPAPPALTAETPAVAPMTLAKVGHGGKKEAVALMIVGAAGIVTGLIADEDIITIAGAGVGGVGLYLYLR
jgi:hypothetical protein